MLKALPMNDEKKTTIWLEWERGTPMSDIARAIEKPPATVFSYLQYHGGIRPRRRQKRPQALALEEREEISRGLAQGPVFDLLLMYYVAVPQRYVARSTETAVGADAVLQ